MKYARGTEQNRPNFRKTGRYARGAAETPRAVKFLTNWGFLISMGLMTINTIQYFNGSIIPKVASTVKTAPAAEAKSQVLANAILPVYALEPSDAPKTPENNTEAENYDKWVGEAVNLFYGQDRGRKSEVRMIMHCLLFYESRHSSDIGHGDNGMAGGPLQFWADTWTRMRGKMIADGYASEMSSRYNMKDAIFTTVYAIDKGWGKEWGPILRDSNGAGWNTCPTPSWY